ncbi:hypothetical protein KEM48_014142 [Puccinia striiformis f. sp. tritici PST-130]|nr:hypothetical protein KEM48_014142 [Puccinia striiformis f. sp. tritici PST-130]
MYVHLRVGINQDLYGLPLARATVSWRHATSTWEAVGVSKVVSCKHFYQKNLTLAQDRSSCRSFVEQFTMAEAPRSLDEDPDWVLNCIDNITTKVDLLRYCKKDDLKVFSVMAAASKADPSRIQMADIRLPTRCEDPLLCSMRRRQSNLNITLPRYDHE